jgi:two-component system, chemotaxis family, chemotaxis protein CheY
MRILVVDDSRTMRMLVIRTLRQAGYGEHDIVEAGDGVEAMEAMARMTVDIVLCDWNMPRMSGIELLKAMRGAGDLRLFGFITSESSPVMRGQAEHEGASFVISKPFDVETFQAVFGGVDPSHATIVHEGLPTTRELADLLSHLIGTTVEVTPTQQQPVRRETAAVGWSYIFPNGTSAAAGALDLRGALGLGTAFGMLPVSRMREALELETLPEELLVNLHEVLNVLVGLYSRMSDLRIALGEVTRGIAADSDIGQILQQPTGRLDAAIAIPGYGGGFLSMVYARSV